jgi:hypothetical protein
VNEYGGLFQGKPLGADGVSCFHKTGELSADGLTMERRRNLEAARPGAEMKDPVRARC